MKCHQLSATDHLHVSSKYTCTATSLIAVGLVQSVKRLTAEREGRGFDSRGRTITEGLKITEK